MMHHGGMPYNEVFVEMSDWPNVKTNKLGGKGMPVIEFPNGC